MSKSVTSPGLGAQGEGRAKGPYFVTQNHPLKILHPSSLSPTVLFSLMTCAHVPGGKSSYCQEMNRHHLSLIAPPPTPGPTLDGRGRGRKSSSVGAAFITVPFAQSTSVVANNLIKKALLS